MTITSSSISDFSSSVDKISSPLNMINGEDKNKKEHQNQNQNQNQNHSATQTEEVTIDTSEPNPKQFYRCMDVVVLPAVKFSAIFMMWVLFHNISANVYATYCAPLSIGGIFQTMIVSQSPHCKLLRYSMDIGVDVIYSIWGVVALWVSSTILHVYPNIRRSKSFRNIHL